MLLDWLNYNISLFGGKSWEAFCRRLYNRLPNLGFSVKKKVINDKSHFDFLAI